MALKPSDTTSEPVTLANWRLAPFSKWSFHNVETLVPVAEIPAGGSPWDLPARPQSVDDITFIDPDGEMRRIDDIMEATTTTGLVVLKSGHLAAERYWHGYDGLKPHILFSVTKSFGGALAGALIERGELEESAPVTRYIPEVAGSAYGDCTVRHVLDMTVSSSFIEDYTDSSGGYARYRRSTLWNPLPEGETAETLHQFLITMPHGKEPHGEIFHYLSPNSDLLGWIIERASGMPYTDALSQYIWQPMGAEAAAQITVDAEGTPRTGGGLCVRLRDLARLGELMRLGGTVNGRRILPAAWVDDITRGGDAGPWRKGGMKATFPEGRYRTKWYQTGNSTGAFCAIGIHGQWLWVDPVREVVIARVAAQPDPVDDPADFSLIRAYEAIAAAL